MYGSVTSSFTLFSTKTNAAQKMAKYAGVGDAYDIAAALESAFKRHSAVRVLALVVNVNTVLTDAGGSIRALYYCRQIHKPRNYSSCIT